jgi:hypothetical protein
MHTEYQRAGFFIFFHLSVPLRGLIFPYNPDYPAYPVKKKKFLCCSASGEKQHALGENGWFYFSVIPTQFVIPAPIFVIPAKAGIHNDLKILDSRFHGNDYSGYLQQNSKVSKRYGILIAFFIAIRY